MDEKKETEETAPKTATGDIETGVQQETTKEIDRADAIAERQKRENDRREEILNREEALAARKAVGGGSEAGQEAPKSKELTDTEYAEALERGEVNPLKEDGIIKRRT